MKKTTVASKNTKRSSFWSFRDALIWVKDRRSDRIDNSLFQPPSLLGCIMYPEMNDCAQWVAAAEEFLDALKNEDFQATKITSDGTELAVSGGYWNERQIIEIEQLCRGILFHTHKIQENFPDYRESDFKERIITPSVAAERDAAKWLAIAFKNDPTNSRSKKSFQIEALKKFKGRLSMRGFTRVWEKIASADGRSASGRKRQKSKQ